MNEYSTGSESTAIIAKRNGPSVATGGSVSGEAYTSTLTTAGTRSTGAAELHLPHGKRSRRRVAKVLPKVKHACYALFRSCIENLDRAIDHDEDFFLRNNAIEQLKDSLSDLWEVRSQREEQFGELINVLQGVFAQRNVENFVVEQLVCLRSVFRRLGEEPVYYDDFANAITVEMLNGGIDAFRGIE